MKISISATNPCHLHPLARELEASGHLGCYYSGYPRWRLPGSETMPIRTHSFRTLVVYALRKFIRPRFRPADRTLFLWQDKAFDRWVATRLEPCDFIHAMPGQCLETFRAARRLGISTVLNHATGPVAEWVRLMTPEYERVDLHVSRVSPFDQAYFDRERQEYELTDYHCAASSVVREQLIRTGIPDDRIWVVPYGADPAIFHREEGAGRPSRFTIVFAGQISLRKGTATLLRALEKAGDRNWTMDFHGHVLPETRADLASYRGKIPLRFHGPVPQPELAAVFRRASALVLPSVEDGFGLVVPQALNCGCPCLVSDRVGAKDLIENHVNGSIVAFDNPDALLEELLWWEQSDRRPEKIHAWPEPARRLIATSEHALK